MVKGMTEITGDDITCSNVNELQSVCNGVAWSLPEPLCSCCAGLETLELTSDAVMTRDLSPLSLVRRPGVPAGHQLQ